MNPAVQFINHVELLGHTEAIMARFTCRITMDEGAEEPDGGTVTIAMIPSDFASIARAFAETAEVLASAREDGKGPEDGDAA